MEKSPSFITKDAARQWVIKHIMETKTFAAENNLWCFTTVKLDAITKDKFYLINFYANDKKVIQENFTNEVNKLKNLNIPFYCANNYGLEHDHEYYFLLEELILH